MAGYNLTDRQRNILSELVRWHEEGKLEGEFVMRGEAGRPGISPIGMGDLIPADKGDLFAFQDESLVTLRSQGGVLVGSLRQRAFEAVASDFGRDAPEVREAPVRRVGLEGLHPEIVTAASNLFTDGHYSMAIFEAFKAIEVRVRNQSGLDGSGRALMGEAFGSNPPAIILTHERGRSGADEQEGFKLIFMGAMQGIRNPKSHELILLEDPQRALEYLALASLLMRRLDDATAQSTLPLA